MEFWHHQWQLNQLCLDSGPQNIFEGVIFEKQFQEGNILINGSFQGKRKICHAADSINKEAGHSTDSFSPRDNPVWEVQMGKKKYGHSMKGFLCYA